MKKLSLNKLYDFFAAVAAKQSLYMPVNVEAGKAEYKKWSEGVELSEALNTLRSAKDFFFPQTENLMEFKTVIAGYEKEDPNMNLAEFMERIALLADVDNHDAEENAVTRLAV